MAMHHHYVGADDPMETTSLAFPLYVHPHGQAQVLHISNFLMLSPVHSSDAADTASAIDHTNLHIVTHFGMCITLALMLCCRHHHTKNFESIPHLAVNSASLPEHKSMLASLYADVCPLSCYHRMHATTQRAYISIQVCWQNHVMPMQCQTMCSFHKSNSVYMQPRKDIKAAYCTAMSCPIYIKQCIAGTVRAQ